MRVIRDSIVLEITDYAATMRAKIRGDSIVGVYHNVGNRGPRTIPFRASRGRWAMRPAASALLGKWDATYVSEGRTSPRVFTLANDSTGMVGAVISNTGDYGRFWGGMSGDSFAVAHFDGSFVYLLTGRLDGDTLRGVFHAGLRSQTPYTAVRSTGARHLTPPTEMTGADTAAPFRFAFPDLSGRIVSNIDARFQGKVVLLDIFGTWCPTCHDATPVLLDLYRRYHARGLEIVGLAYEVTGDTAVDAEQVRRFQRKFAIPYPLLLAGVSDAQAAGATLPQLRGFSAFPTSVFLGRDGRVRLVHAGFVGPATGVAHDRQVAEFRATIESLLHEARR
ncbi:MAG: TlpA family protein disulfide reductase [Gemmatimonadales bacterium]|nr:TlpA family protein disulfide reductase [Gemmatimonadales bacterium]